MKLEKRYKIDLKNFKFPVNFAALMYLKSGARTDKTIFLNFMQSHIVEL